MTPVPEDNSRVGYPFVAVPTEVQEAIYERELTLREAKVALRLIRLVEGFKRTSVAITMEELGASIGMDRVSCQKVVSGMLRDAILICHAHPGKGPGKAGRYSINRNVGEWRRAKVSVASDSNSGPASKCRPRQQVSVAQDSK